MIESREQRKRSSRLRRSKIIIIISVVLVAISAIALYFVYDYVNNVIPYVDEADGITYYIKPTNGVWAMYDADGKLLEKEDAFGYYVTKSGTLVEVKSDTGEHYTRAVPDISDGELTEYEKVLIFKHIAQKNIRSIEIHNQTNSFTFYRYNITETKTDDTADFVLRGSPFLTVKKDLISSLAVSTGYPLATQRVDGVMMVGDEVDYAEYGLLPEKRVRTEKDKDGNEIQVEYDYVPSYYILTTTSGERYKMIIGDRLVNGKGYYAQYVELDGDVEKPRAKVYVLGNSIGTTVLTEPKTFITPGIAYPVTQSDYYDVDNFVLSKKENGALVPKVSFSFIDLADRTGTVNSSRPYVFTDERSNSYRPNYDKIDACLLAFMNPTIVDIAVLSPSYADRAKYGLMKEETDENGNPVLDENGNQKYVYDAEYVISFDRTAKDENGSDVTFNQTIYISKKNERGNYYSYTVISLDKIKVSLDMISEVSGDTYNFLSYDEHDWVYPYIFEMGINYVTNITVTKPDYSASFDVTHTKDGETNAIKVVGNSSTGSFAETFDLLKFTDSAGNHWLITETDVKVYAPDGTTEMFPTGKLAGVNDIGDRVKYLEKPVKDAEGNVIYVKLNEIKIDYANGESKTFVRHHTMIFKKLFTVIYRLAIIDDYNLSEAEEQALLNDSSKYLATIKITDNEGTITNVDFYSLTSRKAYIVVNGEGGYYVSMSAIQNVFDGALSFFNCEDIKT